MLPLSGVLAESGNRTSHREEKGDSSLDPIKMCQKIELYREVYLYMRRRKIERENQAGYVRNSRNGITE